MAEPNPIDRFIVIDTLKDTVDEEHKQAKAEAELFFAEMREKMGATALTAPMFGADAGEFKPGRSKAKTVVNYTLKSEAELSSWLKDNTDAAIEFALDSGPDFPKWWFERTGEVAGGIDREEVQVPGTETAPKFYGKNGEIVKDKLSGEGGFFAAANRLLLGDGE